MSSLIDSMATLNTRIRYNRIAPFYDWMGSTSEGRFGPWRQRLWARVSGGKILEVGVGTGKNFAYYPRGQKLTGIDLSDRMLGRARKRAQQLETSVDLTEGDVQKLTD